MFGMFLGVRGMCRPWPAWKLGPAATRPLATTSHPLATTTTTPHPLATTTTTNTTTTTQHPPLPLHIHLQLPATAAAGARTLFPTALAATRRSAKMSFAPAGRSRAARACCTSGLGPSRPSRNRSEAEGRPWPAWKLGHGHRDVGYASRALPRKKRSMTQCKVLVSLRLPHQSSASASRRPPPPFPVFLPVSLPPVPFFPCSPLCRSPDHEAEDEACSP